jgi:hypothetical protein
MDIVYMVGITVAAEVGGECMEEERDIVLSRTGTRYLTDIMLDYS